MQDVRIRWALAAVCIAILFSGGAVLYAGRHAPPPVLITSSVPSDSPAAVASANAPVSPAAIPAAAPAPAGLIYVHVAGAVRNPSLYGLPAGSRVMQAIKAAGGPLNKADLDAVNLAERVQDGEKIYIPRKGPTHSDEQVSEAPAGNRIGHESIIPTVPPLPLTITPLPGISEQRPSGHWHGSGSHGGPGKLTSPADGQINLNTATSTDLQRLPGIGPAIAARIIAYREQSGRFKTAQDLTQVSGIGDKKMAKILPFVRVD